MGQLATTKIQSIQNWLTSDKMTKSLAVAIRMPGVTPQQIVRIALAAVQRDNKLAECTPASICSSVVTACQLGLEPDNVSGLAYLVPFKDRKSGTTICVLIPGYRGLVQLAYRSGQVGSFETRVVYERDEHCVDWGSEPPITHRPTDRKDRGDIVAVYSKVRLNTGGTVWEWMWNHEVEEVRDRYARGSDRPDSAWQTDYPAQARKTVARRACKWVPSSSQLQRAVTLGDQAAIGIPQDLEPIDGEIVAPETTPKDDLADARERMTKKPEPVPPPLAQHPARQTGPPPPPTQEPAVPEPPAETTPTDDFKPIGFDSDLYAKIRRAFDDLPSVKRDELRGQLGVKLLKDIAKWNQQDAGDALIKIQDAATVKK